MKIFTCKELAEVLLRTPDKEVTVSVDDGTGLQCSAGVIDVKDDSESLITLITEEPEILD